MNLKRILITAIAAAFAFAALPAVASAVTVDYESEEDLGFSVEGENAVLETASGTKVTCSTVTATEAYLTKNTNSGHIQLLFHGCKGPLGVNCTTPGQSTGTITTTTLEFHLGVLPGGGKPLILITSNSGHFASFKCSFLASIVVTGNGIIGEVSSPGFDKASSTGTINYEASEGEQAHTTIEGVEGAEEEYGLEASINEGEPEAATQAGTGEITFEEKVTLTE